MAKKKESIKQGKKKAHTQQSKSLTQFNIIFIHLQLLLTFLTAGLFIWYIIDSSMIYLFQLFLGITLLVMAYNNQIIYRRKLATVAYSVVGIVLLILDLVMYLGVYVIGA